MSNYSLNFPLNLIQICLNILLIRQTNGSKNSTSLAAAVQLTSDLPHR